MNLSVATALNLEFLCPSRAGRRCGKQQNSAKPQDGKGVKNGGKIGKCFI
jgi:hypothetical protein